MSATLKTENYELPIYSNEDHTDWIDFNTAMEKIDGDMKSISNSGESTAIVAEENTNAITAMQKTIEQMQTSDLSVANRVSANENAIANLTQDVNNLETEMPVLRTDVDAATESVNGLTTKTDSNTNKISENTNKISALTTEVNSLDTRVETLEGGTMSGGSFFTVPLSNVEYTATVNGDRSVLDNRYFERVYTHGKYIYGVDLTCFKMKNVSGNMAHINIKLPLVGLSYIDGLLTSDNEGMFSLLYQGQTQTYAWNSVFYLNKDDLSDYSVSLDVATGAITDIPNNSFVRIRICFIGLESAVKGTYRVISNRD